MYTLTNIIQIGVKMANIHFLLGNLSQIISNKLPSIAWERCGKDDNLPLPFDGVPYVFLGAKDYQCHQGKDKNLLMKKKFSEKKETRVRGVDHVQHIKSRKLAQPTKKLDCPVRFSVKKLYRFPEYKIFKDTSWQRSNTSKKIKSVLRKLNSSNSEGVPGYLEYVTKFPRGR